MKNNTMLKKVLKAISFLALCFGVTCVDARPMGAKGSFQSRGAQRRTTQGRYAARTRQQPASKATSQQIIPTETPPTISAPANQPAAQTSQQSAPTNVGANAAKWRALKRLLLNKKESPSEALEIVKKIRTKTLTEEQEEWLDMFEGWMVLAMLQKSGQLVGTGSADKTKQQGALLEQPTAQVSESIDAQKWEQIKNFLNEKVKAGLSSKALEYVQYIKEKYISQKPLMFTNEQQKWLNDFEQSVKLAETTPKQVEQSVEVSSAVQSKPGTSEPKQTFLGIPISNAPAPKPTVTEIDPVTGLPKSRPISVEPFVPAQPQRQGALQKAWAERPGLYEMMGGFDPNLTSKPVPQEPVKQPKKPGALKEAWSGVSLYGLMGGSDPSLISKPTAQTTATASQPASTMTKESWESLQRSLNKAALLPSQDLLQRIEKIKQSYPFNDEQKKYFAQLEEKVKAALVSEPALVESSSTAQATVAQPRPGSGLSEQEWKNLIALLTQAAEYPSQELLNEIEKIKKNPVLNNDQRERLEGFQQTMKALIPK